MPETATDTAERRTSNLKNTTASIEPDNPHSDEGDERLIPGHQLLAEFLTGRGYRTSKSTISKYCSPAINIGPPVEGYWGRWPLFKPSRALAWAKARTRPPDEAHSRPAIATGNGVASDARDGAQKACLEAATK